MGQDDIAGIPINVCAIVCLLTFGIAGCIPTVSSFYDINGPGDKSYTAGCSMSTEANLSMTLTNTTNVVFWGPANRNPSDQKILSIIFTVSGNEIVSLTQPIVEVTTNAAKEPLAIPVTTIRRTGALSSPSCNPMDGSVYQAPDEPMRRVLGTYHSRPVEDSVFVVDINIPGNPNEFSVRVPPVKVDDKIIEIPTVQFVRKTKAQLIGAFSGSTIG
jgi:hypothetical protein